MKKSLIITTVVLVFLGGCYALFVCLIQIGMDEGYKPVQPIHFSHKIHVGDNQVDCQHCHSGACSSAMAVVPSLSMCMGYHRMISEYEGEEDLTQDYTKAFYTVETEKLYATAGWDGQQFKCTGKPQGIQWVHIHKLPDFTYFNHSQHVKVARLDCQQCHGEVPEMEIVRQHAPFAMGWCMECHRTQEISTECAKCHY